MNYLFYSMLFFYFFTAKKMSPNIDEEKSKSSRYQYTRMHGSVSESLSLTLKEVSLQMDDDAERWRIYALLTCVVTVIFDIFLGAAAFVCAAITDSSAGYAFALDCLLDAVAATLVLWRFYGSSSENSDSREKKACFWLGTLLCFASIGIIAKSTCDLASHTVPQQLVYVFILAGVGGAMNSMLGGVKYWLGKKMQSESLTLEAVNTLLSAVLALMLAVSDILFYYHPKAWTIDPVTSIFVAVILFSGGIRVLCRRKRSEETTPLLASGAV